MPKGVKITNDTPGEGREARRGDVVVINLRIFLNMGDEVTAEYPESPRMVIDLGLRETIPGIRYGIEGMRAGGKRAFTVSPHLAYGDAGSGVRIPPKAMLRCEAELLEVHDRGYREPVGNTNGDLMTVFIPGSVRDSKVRCQLTVAGDGRANGFITRPRPDGSWRRSSLTPVWIDAEPERCAQVILEMRALSERHPDECLANDELWSDSSEPANGITRDRATDTPCVSISFGDFGAAQEHFSIKSTSSIWRDSSLRAELVRWLEEHLQPHEIY